MNGDTVRISVEEIDKRDRFFCTSYLRDDALLRKSILGVGLLVPIWIKERKGAEGYQLLSGFRRFDVCCELGFTEIQAWIAHTRAN